MEHLRVVVAAGQPSARLGLRLVLDEDPGMTVVGEAGDAAEALRLAGALVPDVVLLDVKLPGIGAPDLVRELRAALPRVKVLVLSARANAMRSQALFEAGGAGHLRRNGPLQAGPAAAHKGALGETFGRQRLAWARRWRDAVRRWASLTEREREVLALLLQGQTNREIAQGLGIAPKTVENHVGSILDKLGVASRAAAAAWAVRNGFVRQAEG